MIPKSIRWRIQLWYTALLATIVVSLLGAFYRHQRVIEYQSLDRDLKRPFTALLPIFGPSNRRPGDRPQRPGMREGGPPDGPRNREGRRPPRPLPEGFGPRHRPMDGERGGRRPDGRGPSISDMELQLAEKNFYCVVFDSEDNITNIIGEAPDGVRPPPRRRVHNPEIKIRPSSNYREAFESTPRGVGIIVGTSTIPIEKKLSVLSLQLVGIGATTIIGGFLMGWFITSRSLKPIKRISSTAQKIAKGDLSGRIKTDDTESELGQLTSVLNDTFSKLQKSFEHQVRFTADASHEMRTPVAVILAKCQFALNRERSNEKYKETIQTCHDSAQHMRTLIDSLLELSRVDSGQFEILRQPGDYSSLAQECANLLQPLAEKRSITMECELSPARGEFDSQRMRQVFINLLSNAVKYNHDGGTITLTVQASEEATTISVEDTGPGISKDQIPHLFERFYRADKARTNRRESTGLGLSITKAIIEAHGGTIEVDTKIGVGSVFRIVIPR